MADYGLEVYDPWGNQIFTPSTNAGRVLLTTLITSSTTYTLPGLAEGIPWVGWRYTRMNFPRPFTWSISGNVITLNAPTAGLNLLQQQNGISVLVGIR